MESIRDATIDGFNEFLSAQRSVPGKTRWTLTQFDKNSWWNDSAASSDIEVVYRDVKGRDVPKLSRATFEPRGSTPLLDAVGATLTSIKAKKKQLVVVVILTDGMENASTEYTREAVQKLTKEREEWGWQFVYLGANQDAFAEAQGLGIMQGTVTQYAATDAGTVGTYAVAAATVSDYRTSGGETQNLSYTVDESGKKKIVKRNLP